jgi:hypothetical protein
MTEHAYPTQAMLGDYVRAAVGLIPTIGILTTMRVGMVGSMVLGGFAVLFAVFGIRTALRHGSHLELTEGALQSSGLVRASVSLRELDRITLAYYSTRRDGHGGWMQLELRSGSSTLRLDSRLGGFAKVVEASARAAEARGLGLGAATQANLRALGIDVRSVPLGLGAAAGEAR